MKLNFFEMDRRKERIGSLLKEEISKIILYQMKNPKIGFITVTDVRMSGDLKIASVYISVLSEKSMKENTIEILNNSKGYIRREIAKKLNLKWNPEINFYLDNSHIIGEKIDKILRKKD
ncbi:MAG: 30S ribosome-binding factor RbfA [Acidobacteriota bacterium]